MSDKPTKSDLEKINKTVMEPEKEIEERLKEEKGIILRSLQEALKDEIKKKGPRVAELLEKLKAAHFEIEESPEEHEEDITAKLSEAYNKALKSSAILESVEKLNKKKLEEAFEEIEKALVEGDEEIEVEGDEIGSLLEPNTDSPSQEDLTLEEAESSPEEVSLEQTSVAEKEPESVPAKTGSPAEKAAREFLELQKRKQKEKNVPLTGKTHPPQNFKTPVKKPPNDLPPL